MRMRNQTITAQEIAFARILTLEQEHFDCSFLLQDRAITPSYGVYKLWVKVLVINPKTIILSAIFCESISFPIPKKSGIMNNLQRPIC